jgi:ABC-type uncharacterized transport system fused permease/ATPase subunit
MDGQSLALWVSVALLCILLVGGWLIQRWADRELARLRAEKERVDAEFRAWARERVDEIARRHAKNNEEKP